MAPAAAPVENDFVGPPVPRDLKPERLDAFGDPLPDGALARFGTLRWRHGSPVFFLSYLTDDKEMLTVCQDGTIRVWEVATGKELRRFGKGGNNNPVQGSITIAGNGAVAMVMQPQVFSGATLAPDRKMLATSGNDGTVRIWDVASGKEQHTWKPNPQIYIGGMVFSPDGKSLAVKSNDQSLRLYNVADGKEIRKLGAQPDARRRVFFGGNPGSSMAFTPDGKIILSGAMEFENNQVTAVIKRYEVETGKEAGTIKGPQGGFQSLALSPDGNTVAWGGNDGVLRLWDLVKDKEIHQMGGPQNGGYANAIAFAPTGKTLVTRSYDQVIRVWDTTTGKEVRQLGGQEIQNANGFVVRAYGYAVSNLAFGADGKQLAAGTTGNTVRQWEVDSGKELTQSTGHHGPVVTLGVSPDGKTALTRAGDNTVHVWDVATSKEIRHYGLPENVMHVFLSADAKTMVLGDYQGTIRTWDALAGKSIKEWKIGQNQNPAFGGFVGLASLAISPDGKTVAVRTYDQSIRLYDSASGRELKTMAEVPVANANGAVGVVLVNYGAPGPMVFSPDGSVLAALSNGGQQFIGRARAMGANSQIQLWDVATAKPLRKIDPGTRGVACMSFAPDGRSVASGNYDGTVSLWEVTSGKERLNFKGGPQGGISVITYSPDGRTLLVSGTDNLVHLFSASSGKEMSHVQGHDGGVVALALAADNRTLISGGVDTTALVYDLSTMTRAEKLQPVDMDADRVEALWKDLASEDAKKAYQAIQALANAKQATQSLQQRIKPIEAPDPKRVAQLIEDLEGEKPFAARQRATEELEKLGELAADALKKVLDDKPGLEMQMRIERLLERLVTGQAPPPDRLRAHRVLEILERVGSEDARTVVTDVAKGAAGARLTRDAQDSLNRMAK